MPAIRCKEGGLGVLLCADKGCRQEAVGICKEGECGCGQGHKDCVTVLWEEVRAYLEWKGRMEGVHKNVKRLIERVKGLKEQAEAVSDLMSGFAHSTQMSLTQKHVCQSLSKHNGQSITQSDISQLVSRLPEMQTLPTLQSKLFEFQNKIQNIRARLSQISNSVSSQKPSRSYSPLTSKDSSYKSDGYKLMASTKKKPFLLQPTEDNQVNLINEDEIVTFGELTYEGYAVNDYYDLDRHEVLLYKSKYNDNTVKSIKEKCQMIGQIDLSTSELLDDNTLGLLFNDSRSQWPFLSTVDFSNCRLTDKSAQYFSNPVSHVSLGGNWLTDTFVSNLNMTNILSLNLCFTYITDKGVQLISEKMLNCRQLDISYTKVTSKGVSSLKNLKYLQKLYVWGGWKYLPRYKSYKYYNRCNNLNKQQNHHCQITSQSLLPSHTFKLTCLCINPKDALPADLLLSNLSNSPTCLYLGGPLHKSILDLVLNGQSLQEIYLEKCELEGCRFRSRVLKKVSLVRCRVSGYIFDSGDGGMVEVMDLRYTTGEVEKVMGRVAGMRNVTELYLSETAIMDSQFQLIAKSLQKLEVLDLNTTKITDAGLAGLSTAHLKVLNLSKTKVTNWLLTTTLPSIHSLYLTQTPITDLPAASSLPTLTSLWPGPSIPSSTLQSLPATIRIF